MILSCSVCDKLSGYDKIIKWSGNRWNDDNLMNSYILYT